jgi:type II secretory pathway pseudopilin PulG
MIREEKGFTLIELALILVIIGIIISIVLKGQDVVESSRMKRFESEVRHWRTSAWLYLERKGRFPGDGDDNGIIGDETTPIPGSTVIQNANLINPPKANPVTAGSLNFWIYWGYDGGSTGQRKLNVMVICANDSCNQAFQGNDKAGNIKYVEFIDAVVDGEIDGNDGLIRASSVTPVLDGTGDDRTVTSVGPSSAWTADSTVAMIYYIEKHL